MQQIQNLSQNLAFDIVQKLGFAQITENDVFIVWCCKTLQNNKALVSTTVSDGMYYEITYNSNKDEIYFDAYKKFENKCYKGCDK